MTFPSPVPQQPSGPTWPQQPSILGLPAGTQFPGLPGIGGAPPGMPTSGATPNLWQNLLPVIAQLALSMGKGGGYRGLGFQQAQQQQQENRLQQQRVALEQRGQNIQYELGKQSRVQQDQNQEFIKMRAAMDDFLGQLPNIRLDDPGSLQELATSVAQAAGLNETSTSNFIRMATARAKIAKPVPKEEPFYVDTTTGKLVSPKKANPDDPNIYVGDRNKENPSVVMERFKAMAGGKAPGLSEQKDADILAMGAARLKKTVEQLTPQERAQIRKDYDIEVSAGRAVNYPGQEFPLYDSAGNLIGFVNRITKQFTPISEGTPKGYGGGTPSVPETAMEQMAGMKTVLDLLKPMEDRLRRQPTLGPIAGRVKVAEIATLGGLGASKEEIELAQDLYRIVTSQAFANGGKQLTITELGRFERLTPQLTDTVAQALAKTRESINFLRMALRNRINSLTPRQREIIHPEIVGATAETSGQMPPSSSAPATHKYDPKTGKLVPVGNP